LFVATIFHVVCSSTANPAAHPELVIAVMNAASSDWAAARLGVAIERVADALLVEEEATPGRRDAVVAVHGVLRP
jgi:hypothetical protein